LFEKCIFYAFLATFMWKTDLQIDIQDTGPGSKPQSQCATHACHWRAPCPGTGR